MSEVDEGVAKGRARGTKILEFNDIHDLLIKASRSKSGVSQEPSVPPPFPRSATECLYGNRHKQVSLVKIGVFIGLLRLYNRCDFPCHCCCLVSVCLGCHLSWQGCQDRWHPSAIIILLSVCVRKL